MCPRVSAGVMRGVIAETKSGDITISIDPNSKTQKIDAKTMQGRLNRIAPGDFPDVPEGGAIWVFAVK